MNIQSFIDSLWLLKPEIAVTAAIIIVVLFELFFPKYRVVLPYISVAGITAAGIFLGFNYYESISIVEQSNHIGLLHIDPMGQYFKLLILVSTALVVFFSHHTIEMVNDKKRTGDYYALLLGTMLGFMLMASAADLIVLYLSLELSALCSYILAGFIRTDRKGSEASLKYFVYGAASSGIMLFGISLFYGIFGTTSIPVIMSQLQNPDFTVNAPLFYIITVMFFTGIGYKISAVPYHYWTPDVYEGAPTSITAYLSVAGKAAGFVFLIRFIIGIFHVSTAENGFWEISSTFPWKEFLFLISILTMTIGNLSALWQTNLKRMLAFSSIAHVGYLLAALSVLSNDGFLAILIYFAVYLFMNLGAFYVVLIIKNKTGKEDINDYNGIGFTSPLVAVALTIFLTSLTGLPPTAGFVGKFYIMYSLLTAEDYILALVLLFNTVISLYYYFRIVKHMYLTKATAETPEIKPAFSESSILILLCVPVLFFGIYFSPLIDFVKSSLTIVGF